MNDLRVDLFRKQAIVLERIQSMGFDYKFIDVENSNGCVHVEFSFGSYKKFIMPFEDFMLDQLELQFEYETETTVEILEEILTEVFNLDTPYETVCKVIEQQFEKHILDSNELIDDIDIFYTDFNVEVVVLNDKGDRRLYIADYDEWLNYSNAERIAWQITEQMIEQGKGFKL